MSKPEPKDRLIYVRVKLLGTISAEKWPADGLGYKLGSKANKQDGQDVVAEFNLQLGEIDLPDC